MYRIDSDGAVEVIPTEESAGATSGYFGRGNPGLGVRATKVSADWLNAVQEELLGVIEDAGVTPSKTNRTQLLEAIEIVAAREVAGASVPGWVQNIGFSYSGGTFTINDAVGGALSALNPGYIALQSRANPGRLKIHTITANQSFIDDAGASEIIGNLLGATTGIAWADDCPFFIYAVTNDDENAVAFMLSRDPGATVSPAAASIGAPDDPVADSEESFFSFDSLNEDLYDANPCAVIGSIRMRMSSSDDWTVQTLTNKDGVGRFHESTRFAFPKNQNGAASGSHIKANGGTQPEFATEDYYYWVKRDRTVRIAVNYQGDAGTDGAGSVNTIFSIPLKMNTSQIFLTTLVGKVGGSFAAMSVGNDSGTGFTLTPTSGATYQHVSFTNADREVRFSAGYQAFSD